MFIGSSKKGQYGAEIRKPLRGVRSSGQDIRRLGVEVINPGKKSYSKARSGILGQGVKNPELGVGMYDKRSGFPSVRSGLHGERSGCQSQRPGKGLEVYHVNKRTSVQETYSWQKAKSSSVHVRAAEHGK